MAREQFDTLLHFLRHHLVQALPIVNVRQAYQPGSQHPRRLPLPET
jgi:hypothetical protein